MFAQTALALAVAERRLRFEHRDLHLGNILVQTVERMEQCEYQPPSSTLDGVVFRPCSGPPITIIDFTFSRLDHSAFSYPTHSFTQFQNMHVSMSCWRAVTLCLVCFHTYARPIPTVRRFDDRLPQCLPTIRSRSRQHLQWNAEGSRVGTSLFSRVLSAATCYNIFSIPALQGSVGSLPSPYKLPLAGFVGGMVMETAASPVVPSPSKLQRRLPMG